MDTSSALFTELSIKGFRRLRDVRLPLRPLSVMIGANGTGKTSVLDVLSLLASSADGKLAASLSELSGLVSVITQGSQDKLILGISMKVTGHLSLDYSLTFVPTDSHMKSGMNFLPELHLQPSTSHLKDSTFVISIPARKS